MSSLALSRNLMTVYVVIFSLLAITISSGLRNHSQVTLADRSGMTAADARMRPDDSRQSSGSVLLREETSEFPQVKNVVTSGTRESGGPEIRRDVSLTSEARSLDSANHDFPHVSDVAVPVTVNAGHGSLVIKSLQPDSIHDSRMADSEVVARSSDLNPAAIGDFSTVTSELMSDIAAAESPVSAREGRHPEPALPTTEVELRLADSSDDGVAFFPTSDASTGDDTQQKPPRSFPEESLVTSPVDGVDEAIFNSGDVPSEVEFQFTEPVDSNSREDRVELSLPGSPDELSPLPANTDAAATDELVNPQSDSPAQKLAAIAETASKDSARNPAEPIIEPARRVPHGEPGRPSRLEVQPDSVPDVPLIIPRSRDAEFFGRAVAVIDPAANRRVSKSAPDRVPNEVPQWDEIDTASAKDSGPSVVPPIPSSNELVAAATRTAPVIPGDPEPPSLNGEAIVPLLPIPGAHMNSMPTDVAQPQRYLGSARRRTVPPGILSQMKQRLSELSPSVAAPDIDPPAWMDQMAERVDAFRAGGKSVASSSEKPQSGSSTRPPRGTIPQKKVPGQNLRQSQHALGKQGMTRPSPTSPPRRPNVAAPELKSFFPEIAIADAERRGFRLPDLKMPSLYLPTWSVPQPRDLSPAAWEIKPYVVELNLSLPEVPQLPEWLVDLPDADPLEPLRNSAAVHRVSSTIRYAAEPKVVR